VPIATSFTSGPTSTSPISSSTSAAPFSLLLSLSRKPYLNEALYERLKLLVAKEETLIYDNTEELTEQLYFEQVDNRMDLNLQRQLLMKVDSV